MQGAKGILNSKRGVFALFVIACATVLAAIRVITGDAWVDMAKYVSGFIIAGHTATSAVEAWRAKQIPQATVVNDKPPASS
jgi:hypothetical protein